MMSPNWSISTQQWDLSSIPQTKRNFTLQSPLNLSYILDTNKESFQLTNTLLDEVNSLLLKETKDIITQEHLDNNVNKNLQMIEEINLTNGRQQLNPINSKKLASNIGDVSQQQIVIDKSESEQNRDYFYNIMENANINEQQEEFQNLTQESVVINNQNEQSDQLRQNQSYIDEPLEEQDFDYNQLQEILYANKRQDSNKQILYENPPKVLFIPVRDYLNNKFEQQRQLETSEAKDIEFRIPIFEDSSKIQQQQKIHCYSNSKYRQQKKCIKPIKLLHNKERKNLQIQESNQKVDQFLSTHLQKVPNLNPLPTLQSIQNIRYNGPILSACRSYLSDHQIILNNQPRIQQFSENQLQYKYHQQESLYNDKKLGQHLQNNEINYLTFNNSTNPLPNIVSPNNNLPYDHLGTQYKPYKNFYFGETEYQNYQQYCPTIYRGSNHPNQFKQHSQMQQLAFNGQLYYND